MGFSRREILKGMGAAGLTPLLLNTGCGSSDSGSTPLPELPEYSWEGEPGPQTIFQHGVASGDPLPEAVIIWTRVALDQEAQPAAAELKQSSSQDPMEVWWEVALDEAFEMRVAQGTVTAQAESDYTIKVDVTELVWGRNYYYRFFNQGRQSPVGRTRLAPTSGEPTEQLRFGVCSCANYGFGYFHSFRHMASREDLDAVLHLGDYFYEYGNGRYPREEEQLRLLEPPNETVTLSDYRTRLGLYRTDPDLQECHRQHPFIVVWDDHETANNSWMGGAENHDPETEGPWEDRVAAARQAFFEWIPIRENEGRQLYRALKYGDLADVIMLDTRIEGREQQASGSLIAPDDPNAPENIISETQEAWLVEQLSSSTATWKILGNQVVMSLWNFEGAYANTDQWNGYPVGRTRLLERLRDNGLSNVVVVTGDVHTSWAMDVTVGDGSYDAETGTGAVAVEFVAPGVTSPGELPPSLIEGFIRSSPHIYFANVTDRGYLVLDVRPEKVQSDWYYIEGLEEEQRAEIPGPNWAVLDGTAHVIEMDGPENPPLDPPPLAG
jgi:alkaline phosphatase D